MYDHRLAHVWFIQNPCVKCKAVEPISRIEDGRGDPNDSQLESGRYLVETGGFTQTSGLNGT